MNLYELFILGVNIKYIVFCILYKRINVPLACKELRLHIHRSESNLVTVAQLTLQYLENLVSRASPLPQNGKWSGERIN